MRCNAHAFAQARFTFSIQPATLSASFGSTTRIESYDAVIHVNERKDNPVEAARSFWIL